MNNKAADPNESPEQQACQMLDCFDEVGVELFDLTLTDLQGNKLTFRRGIRLADLRRQLPHLITETTRCEQNLIVRPRSTRTQLIQLDDLTLARLEQIAPFAFLTLETSPNNHQAWIALPTDTADENYVRRLRKGIEADLTASGAVRMAGSRNFKTKYAPRFPQVKILHGAGGLVATLAQLESSGLVAEPESVPPPRASRPFRTGAKAWPSYERCLSQAPANNAGTGPDVSRADFTYCLISLDWGWGVEATIAQLLEQSAKAKTDGRHYAELTVNRAAEALAKRTTAPPRRP